MQPVVDSHTEERPDLIGMRNKADVRDGSSFYQSKKGTTLSSGAP